MTTQLAKLEEYQRLLAIVETPQEAGVLRTQMEAIAKTIAPRLSKDRFKWSKAYVESCIKHGEMWNACDNKATQGYGMEKRSKNIENVITINDALFKNHMDLLMCSRIATLDRQDVDLYFDDCRSNGKYPTLGGAYNIWRMLNPSDPPPPPPPGIYNIIYADPPWQYDFSRSPTRTIENQYPTMELEEIKELHLPEIAEDAVLFLWATSPKLIEALEVIEAWGFEYKTNMVWTKDKIGMGYYARQQHELLLIAGKGDSVVPPEDTRPSSIIQAPRLEHSAKPKIVYEIIERMYPSGRPIELFARGKRKGWTSWGHEV